MFIVGLNIFLPFMFPNSISWQAHVGGLITGIVITYIQILIVKNKSRNI
ncbi:MAG: rhomboid family intramembrane serine protease [Bifidobacteriaceae bacterium]|nr:rhomboid family intramembrane serine protease [Bifidobacteriaceae bacterium]